MEIIDQFVENDPDWECSNVKSDVLDMIKLKQTQLTAFFEKRPVCKKELQPGPSSQI